MVGIELDGPVQCCLLAWSQGTIAAGRQIAQAYRTVGEPGQTVNLEPQRLTPAPDDPVSPLDQRQVQNAPALGAGANLDLAGHHRPAVDHHPLPRRLRDLRGRTAVYQGGVASGNMV